MSKLIIRGDYKGIHGYGALIRSHLKALESANIPFRLMYVKLDPQRLCSQDVKQWELLEVKEALTGDTVVHYMEAPYLEKISGVRNIAYTLFEADALPQLSLKQSRDLAWVEILNSFDEVWTGSSFGKITFEKSGVTRPISVLHWSLVSQGQILHPDSIPSLRINSWKPQETFHRKLRPLFNFLGSLPENIRGFLTSLGYFIFKILVPLLGYTKSLANIFCSKDLKVNEDEFRILVVNTWNTRKNIEDSIKSVLSTFSNRDRVRLIIKTYDGISSWWMRAIIVYKVQNIINSMKIPNGPSIDLILNPLNENQMQFLFSIADIYLNTSKGEGLGGGVIQSMAHGVPVVTHSFSSVSDFCHDDDSFIYDYSLEPVSWDFNFYGMGQRWARPNMESLESRLSESWALWKNDRNEFEMKGVQAKKNILKICHPEKIIQVYSKLIDKH